MNVTSKTTKTLAAITVAGILTFGGATAAFAADGTAGTDSGGAATSSVRGNHPRAFRAALRTAFGAAAQTLGMSTDELRQAVVGGHQSIAQVAGDRAGEVSDAVTAALNARLDDAVANGKVTSDQATKLRDRIPTAVDRFLNRVPGPRAT